MPIDLVSQLISAAIRAVALGLIAFVGLLLIRIRSSAARHAVWTVVLVGMLLQIPLAVVAPTVLLKALPTLPAPIQPPVIGSARVAAPAAQNVAPASHTRTEQKGRWVSSSGTLTGIYLAISMLLFIRMALGTYGLRRIVRDAKAIPNLGPGIFESIFFVVPGSVGCFQARILLPRAWRDWDAVKLRAVLAHERAHIRRRDWLIRVASHVNVCIFWFHPLAWWMERELARLAEEACDDVALSEIEEREQYAATLVHIARAAAAAGGILNWHVVSMANESNVIRRVNRILNRGLHVPKPFGRLAWVTLLACSLPMIYLSAAVKLASANRDSNVLQHAVARREDPPITMCILIDNSGSMRDKRALVKAAALALVKASKPHDAVCIVDFNDDAFNELPHGEDFTSDIKKMQEALTHIDSRGGSAMRDAVRMSIDHLEQKAHNDRRLLVLLTDGDDTSSTVTQEQLLGKVKNSRVRIYCIGLAATASLALRQLAEVSGGQNYYPKDLAEVERISPKVLNEARKQ